MLFSIIVSAVLATLLSKGCEGVDERHKVVCYYGSWSTYRYGNGKFTSEHIDPKLCTHVVYQYAGLGADGGILVLDTWLSLDSGLRDFRKFTDLKRSNKDIKLLIGIGGWNEGPKKFSRMASSAGGRTYFVSTVVDFISTYGFDGLSIDWMYPGDDSSGFDDKDNFISLLRELREAFASRNWVLSIVGSANVNIVERGFDVRGISRYVDFVSLLSFDYHGSWEHTTGHNSPLFPRRDELGDARKGNQDYTVKLWIEKGMDPSKLILGIPTYGRTFTLQSVHQNNVGAPSIRPGAEGRYTQQAGLLGYNELMEYLKEDGSMWTIKWDDEHKIPYAQKGNFWISYDNPDSVRIKSEYILQQGLGGAMIYSLETDDFNGHSGQTFPLVKMIRHTLNEGKWDPQSPSTTSSITDPTPTKWVPPTSNPKPDAIICKRPGMIKDPENCNRYYVCVENSDNTYRSVLAYCPAGLGWDERINNCNYLSDIPGCH